MSPQDVTHFFKSSALKTTIISTAALWPLRQYEVPTPFPGGQWTLPLPGQGRPRRTPLTDEDPREWVCRGRSSCEPAWPQRRESMSLSQRWEPWRFLKAVFLMRAAKNEGVYRVASPQCTRRGEAPRCCLQEPQKPPRPNTGCER